METLFLYTSLLLSEALQNKRYNEKRIRKAYCSFQKRKNNNKVCCEKKGYQEQYAFRILCAAIIPSCAYCFFQIEDSLQRDKSWFLYAKLVFFLRIESALIEDFNKLLSFLAHIISLLCCIF